MTLRLAFAGPLVYTRNEGFRTADLSFPFKALGSPEGDMNPKWWARWDSNPEPRDSLNPAISRGSGLSLHPRDCAQGSATVGCGTL